MSASTNRRGPWTAFGLGLGLLMTIITAKGQREALQINLQNSVRFRRRAENAK